MPYSVCTQIHKFYGVFEMEKLPNDQKHPELKYKYRNREFWCRGYL